MAQPVPTAGNNTVALDPFKRELIHKGLVTIADNMILTVVRTSRSTVVKNNLDFYRSLIPLNSRQRAQRIFGVSTAN